MEQMVRMRGWLSEDNPWRDRLLLSVLTVLLLIGFWTVLPARFQANQNYDYFCCYLPAAQNWIDGNGFIYSNGAFAARYPPGFSILLAGVLVAGRWIGEELAIRIFTILCGVGAVLGLYAAGRSIGGAWTGRIAGLCLISYPFFLWMFKQPNSEVLFLPLVIWGFYGYLRFSDERGGGAGFPGKWAAFAGCFWGLSTLVRPISILVPFGISACYVLFGRNQSLARRTGLAAILLAVSVATVLPWEIVARQELGRWILIANDDNSFVEGMTFAVPGVMKANPAPVDPDVLALMQRAVGQRKLLKSIGGFLTFVKAEAQANPGAVFKLFFMKARRAWYTTYEGYFENVNMAVQLVFLTMSVSGLWWMRRTKRAAALGIATVLACFWSMTLLVLPLLRYMIPPTVVMLLAMAFAVEKLAERWTPGLIRMKERVKPVYTGS